MTWKYLVVSWFITFLTTTTTSTSNDVPVRHQRFSIFNFIKLGALVLLTPLPTHWHVHRVKIFGKNAIALLTDSLSQQSSTMRSSVFTEVRMYDVDSLYTSIDKTWKYQKMKDFALAAVRYQLSLQLNFPNFFTSSSFGCNSISSFCFLDTI